MPRKKAANKELTELLAATGTTLTDLHGIGPSGAARLLGRRRRHHPLPDRGHFASWNGTAPIDASSGDQVRHRLSRAGNRQINRVLHIMAIVQLRNPTEGRAYYDRKQSRRQDLDGSDALPQTAALRRRLSPAASPTHVAALSDEPGRTTGDDSDSSAADSHPDIGTSDQPLPGPARRQPRTPLPAAS